MTPEERGNPAMINPSTKKRIAKGAGVDIAEVNKLIKQFEQSRKMMKQMSGMMSGKGKKERAFRRRYAKASIWFLNGGIYDSAFRFRTFGICI